MARRATPISAAGLLLLAACGASDADDANVAAAPGAGSAGTTDTAASTTGTPESTGGTGTSTSTEGTGATVGDSDEEPGRPFAVDQVESSPLAVTNSGYDAWRTRIVPTGIPEPLVDFDEIRSGGPPPDGIPPIDAPLFLRTGHVDFLADNEPVLALEIDGDARAYPVQIMTWHEIVNDTVAGIPVSVTYCPLCNSAIAYDRRHDDLVLDFGTSGLLWNSALVMYDRQTQTLWSHYTGQGVIGELTGDELDDFPVTTVAWEVWRDANPDGLVLSRDTGFDRPYGRNPYPGYDDVNGIPFLFQGEVDGRYTALTRIVGIEVDGDAVGIPLVDLQNRRTIAGTVGTTPLVAWWIPGTASALDASDIAAGNDVGATGVFVPEIDGTTLTFTATDDDTFVDDQTASTWNVFGEAIDGELAGAQLAALSHVDTFWFAWSTFRADTEVLTD
jgi:hypothetical protein